MFKFIKFLLGATLLIGSIAYLYYIQFSNPDMTQTRLLLDFWWQHLTGALLVILGLMILKTN